MRGTVIISLLVVTALGAYSIGRQSAPTTIAAPAPTQPLALADAAVVVPLKPPPHVSLSGVTSSPSLNRVNAPDKAPPTPESRHRIDAALTAATIAAILIKASRDQYHATGKPCACPDDVMRNGRACGGRSAYSRPGGAAPICYTHDVTTAMIDAYRQRTASR